jgi:hypothetical protein
MTRSIVLGGIVGIAIGAIITFAIAHGVFELSTARADIGPAPAPHMLPADDEDLDTLSSQATTRPLRPGSNPRGVFVGAAHASSTRT